jgi:hypothetical protein
MSGKTLIEMTLDNKTHRDAGKTRQSRPKLTTVSALLIHLSPEKSSPIKKNNTEICSVTIQIRMPFLKES